LVQLAGILCNEDTREVIDTIDVIIKPNGWVITPENAAIHGTTHEIAEANGIDEAQAIQRFLEMCEGATRVAHNRTFDQRIIRIGMKRYGHSEAALELWAQSENHRCTMLQAKPIMKMEPKNRYGFKSPKLSEAFKYFTGNDLEDAHTAMADAHACMLVYWAMRDAEKQEAA
jgi:DNA polymerase III subunit epsilon